jgi:hypothetical protein
MKKLFTLFFILSLFSCMMYAQVQAGLKVGSNISSLYGDDVISAKTKTGYVFGGYFTFQFDRMLAIQPEVYYSMKGAKDRAAVSDATPTITYTLDYIEIPILLKMIVPLEGSNFKPALFVGPYMSFVTTSKIKTELAGESEEHDYNLIHSLDLGLQWGVGIGFNVWGTELGLDFRCIIGLSPIDRSAKEYDIKNNVYNFNLYYGFSL